MQTFRIPCSFPADPVHVFLFTQILNANELRTRLLAGDVEYTYAFLDADLVRCPVIPRLLTFSDREPFANIGCR